MEQYLIDNNIISNYFSGIFKEKTMTFIADVIDQIPNISIITEIEALSWINADKAKEAIVKDFVQDAIVLGLNPAIVAQCVKIRRNRKIKTPDAIIAATEIIHNLTLITNDNDFVNIPNLKVINPSLL